MALGPGARLGPYEVVAKLGEGGMGEVYKGTDTRLSRTVAIKVLPPHWAADAEMQQRFEHEARTVASLNHPNICVLHDIGADNGIDYLVMEFLDGETLADKIRRGPVPLDEALDIAIAVTDALDKAHRQGVVHRDLKPSNVMLTTSGPKLLDFGLAKTFAGAQDPAAGQEAAVRSGLTVPGMLIGTLQYMAPEQLEGGDADGRTDIFALGVLLHEMVTGKRVFEGKSRVLLMSAIATAEPPPLSSADPATPPALDHVVRTCLAKDPADRWQTARDLLAELQAIATGADEGFVAASLARRSRARHLPRVLAGGALVAGLVMSVPASLYLRAGEPPDELRFRVPIQLSTDANSLLWAAVTAGVYFDPGTFAVSPDGRWLSFSARSSSNDPWRLYVKPLGGLAPQAYAGTDNVEQSFWSPDGRWVAFVANGMLKKVDVKGGEPVDLCRVTDFLGGSWNAAGTIVFGSAKGLFKVSEQGGTPEPLAADEESAGGAFWPHFLPDGEHVLYTAAGDTSALGIHVGALGSPERVKVLDVPSNGAYVAAASGGGYLLFSREAAVYAQPFDPTTFALSGEPRRIADDVTADRTVGRGHFSASLDGAVAYFQNTETGDAGGRQSEQAEWHLAWVSRTGQEQATPGPPGVYRSVELGPDHKRILVHRHEKTGGDIWVFEPTGAETRLTWDPSQHNASPIWSPDGKTMVFSSVREGKVGLYRKPTDGSGVEELLFESELPIAPMSWSPDGHRIVFGVQHPKTGADLWVLSLEDQKAAPFIATPYTETHAQISPDGKWIAYASDSVNERREIHVQAFPSGAGHWQVSNAGGDWPRWRQDTKELLYHSIGPSGAPSQASFLVQNGPIYSVTVDGSGQAFVFSRPSEVLLLQVLGLPHPGGDYHTYAISPDAQQFLYFQYMVSVTGTQAAGIVGPDAPSGLMVVRNWAR